VTPPPLPAKVSWPPWGPWAQLRKTGLDVSATAAAFVGTTVRQVSLRWTVSSHRRDEVGRTPRWSTCSHIWWTVVSTKAAERLPKHRHIKLKGCNLMRICVTYQSTLQPATILKYMPCFQSWLFCYKLNGIALHGKPISELRSVTCHMGSHSVTCHPTQVNRSTQPHTLIGMGNA